LEKNASKNQLRRFDADDLKDEIKQYDQSILKKKPFVKTINFGKD
jgi:hypothetical protein